MSKKPIMAKATAVWLTDNTTLTFDQIADFCGMHRLEVQGIADGEVAVGVLGFDPVASIQLDAEDIKKGERDPAHRLTLVENINAAGEHKKRSKIYTPMSKRQDRPGAALWLLRHHAELNDSQVARLVGATTQTVKAIRTQSHWNMARIEPVDPVMSGFCRMVDLNNELIKAQERQNKAEADGKDESKTLMSTNQSLASKE